MHWHEDPVSYTTCTDSPSAYEYAMHGTSFVLQVYQSKINSGFIKTAKIMFRYFLPLKLRLHTSSWQVAIIFRVCKKILFKQ